MVAEVRRRLGPDRASERRTCRLLGQPRSTQRYQRRPPDDEGRLMAEMRRITRQCPRFGCPRVHRQMVENGWKVNHKKEHRLWMQELIQVPRKQHRRRRLPGGSENGCNRHRAERKDHVWSYDFLMDQTEVGQQLKLLAVIDEYTRECPAIEMGRSFTAHDVIGTLQYLFAVPGTPEYLRS